MLKEEEIKTTKFVQINPKWAENPQIQRVQKTVSKGKGNH